MISAKDELVQSWMIKAGRDLRSAAELSAASPPLLDTAAYHCQQAAEKALKGFLVFHDIRFDKTHDIEVLLSQASTIDRAFSSWASAAGLLTPLAVEYRYPGAFAEPEPDEFKEAYESASQLFAFVLERLPDIVKPK